MGADWYDITISCKVVYCRTRPRKKGDSRSSKARYNGSENALIKLPAAELDGEGDGELGELEEMRETELIRDVDTAERDRHQQRRKSGRKRVLTR